MDNIGKKFYKGGKRFLLKMNIFCSESPEFYLAYNPLECDCRTDWLVKMEDLALSGPYPLIVDMDRYTPSTDWLVKKEDLALSRPYPLIVDMDRYT